MKGRFIKRPRFMLFIFLFFLYGCYSQKGYVGSQDFSLENAQKIEIGLSTKENVENVLGDPVDTRNIDEGIYLWTYRQEQIHSHGSIRTVPLINLMSDVLTLGYTSPKVDTLSSIECNIIFKDGVVDDIAMVVMEKDGKKLIDPRIKQNQFFYEKYKAGKLDPSFEVEVFKPSAYRVLKRSTNLDAIAVEFWISLFEFDISRMPPESKIEAAILRCYSKEKYLCSQIYNNKEIYAPLVHRAYSLTQEDMPHSIGLPAVDSETTLKAGKEAALSMLLSVVSLGSNALRSVYVLDRPGWDVWVVTPLIKNTNISGLNSLFIMLQPDYGSVRGYDYGGMGLKYPILCQYHSKTSLKEANMPMKYEPYLEIIYSQRDDI